MANGASNTAAAGAVADGAAGTAAPSSPRRFAHTPYTPVCDWGPSAGVVAHKGLCGAMAFVPYGELADVPPTPSDAPLAPECSLFIGQVRYETTPGQLASLLQRAAKAAVERVEVRPKGCFVVTLRSPADADAVRALRRRVLFDVCGVWVAGTGRSARLVEYVQSTGRHVAGPARLPHDCMVVEECRPRAARAVPTKDSPAGDTRHPRSDRRPPPPAYVNEPPSPSAPPQGNDDVAY